MPRLDNNHPVSGQQLDAEAELAIAAASEAASKALGAGAHAPWFTLADSSGNNISLESLLSSGPVVLHFFRGAWCTFGEESLAGLAATYEDVAKLGATAVAIAPPGKPSVHRSPLPMRELVDVNMKVARAFGLAFQLPAGLRARYAALGYVPPATRRPDSWLVPVPATYLLDRDGTVILAYVDVDYRNHFDMQSMLIALKALHTRQVALGREPVNTNSDKHRK